MKRKVPVSSINRPGSPANGSGQGGTTANIPAGCPGDSAVVKTNGYRYAFNGKERNAEFGEDDYDYGERMYDARIGRFLSVDPLTSSFPHYSPYQFAGNKPIQAVDLDGSEELLYNFRLQKELGGRLVIEVINHTDTWKRFEATLKAQNKFDVYVTNIPPEKNSSYGSRITFDEEGYASPGRKGLTDVLENEVHILTTGFYTDYERFLQSINQGKSIIVLAATDTYNQEISTEFGRMFGAILMDNNTQIKTSMSRMRNILEAYANTIIHEAEAHGKNELKGTPKPAAQEHKDFHGSFGSFSPSWKEVKENPENFRNTPQGNVRNEVIDAVNRVLSD
ncbi:MAG: hypothetical protein KF690_04655 [Bacteroidetes bacterium]|nr:hypothetical protein [Bacteroidota bacterium]